MTFLTQSILQFGVAGCPPVYVFFGFLSQWGVAAHTNQKTEPIRGVPPSKWGVNCGHVRQAVRKLYISPGRSTGLLWKSTGISRASTCRHGSGVASPSSVTRPSRALERTGISRRPSHLVLQLDSREGPAATLACATSHRTSSASWAMVWLAPLNWASVYSVAIPTPQPPHACSMHFSLPAPPAHHLGFRGGSVFDALMSAAAQKTWRPPGVARIRLTLPSPTSIGAIPSSWPP